MGSSFSTPQRGQRRREIKIGSSIEDGSCEKGGANHQSCRSYRPEGRAAADRISGTRMNKPGLPGKTGRSGQQQSRCDYQ